MYTAQKVMTTGVITIPPHATVGQAIELLLHHRISGLPVTNASGELVGMISEYALLAMAYDKHVLHQSVSAYMSRDVLTVEPDTPINTITDLLILHRVGRLPVVEGNQLVGLISRVDVLRAMYETSAPYCTV